MARFKVGDYLVRSNNDINTVWKVINVDDDKYHVISIKHPNHVFKTGHVYLLSTHYIELYYKTRSYENIIAKMI